AVIVELGGVDLGEARPARRRGPLTAAVQGLGTEPAVGAANRGAASQGHGAFPGHGPVDGIGDGALVEGGLANRQGADELRWPGPGCGPGVASGLVGLATPFLPLVLVPAKLYVCHRQLAQGGAERE